jgi:hypothetical protein
MKKLDEIEIRKRRPHQTVDIAAAYKKILFVVIFDVV